MPLGAKEKINHENCAMRIWRPQHDCAADVVGHKIHGQPLGKRKLPRRNFPRSGPGDLNKRSFGLLPVVNFCDEAFALQLGDEAPVDEVFDLQLTRLGYGGGELF